MVTIRSKSYARLPSGIAFAGEMPWDGIIGAAGNIIGSVIGSKASKYAANKQLQATRETNATNVQLAREQNDWNLAQWQRETDYNTTEKQLKRWMAAGLNPNSFAGQASPSVAADSPQSADLANQQVPDLSALRDIGPQLQRGINDGLQYMLQSKQLSILNKEADARIKNLGKQNEQIQAVIDKIMPEQVKLSREQQKTYQKQREVMQGELSTLDAKINLFNAQANSFDTSAASERLKMRMFLDTWNDQKMSYKLSNALMSAQIGLTKQQAENYAEQLKGIIIDNGIKAKDFSFKDVDQWLMSIDGITRNLQGQAVFLRQQAIGNLFGALNSFLSNPFNPSDSSRGQQAFWKRVYDTAPPQLQSWLNPTMP